MSDSENDGVTEDELARRRVPCLIAYLNPFRMIEAESISVWDVTIEQINKTSWDYVALHEIAGGIDVGLPSPYHLVVARDGALALPPIKSLLSDQAAVAFFNRCLAALLIGGVYCEALTNDSLDLGSIIDWKYVRSQRPGHAAPNRFHEQIRRCQASAIEAIALYRPNSVDVTLLKQAMKVGLGVLEEIKTLSGEYLLKGVTGIARRDWGSGLANLWIVAEQLTSCLWISKVVCPTLVEDPTKTRRSQLEDNRTWTMSARLEVLNQKELLPLQTFKQLSAARRARNDLSHQGIHPSEDDARNAYAGVCGLLSLALNGGRPPLFDLDLKNHSLSDPFAPPRPIMGEPEFWMEIPKLPGERELELAEARARNSRQATSMTGEGSLPA